MMNEDKYLENLLVKQYVPYQPKLEKRVLSQLRRHLTDWTAENLAEFKMSGSYVRRSVVARRSDMDVRVEVTPSDREDLEGAVRHLLHRLADLYWLRPGSKLPIPLFISGLNVDLLIAIRGVESSEMTLFDFSRTACHEFQIDLMAHDCMPVSTNTTKLVRLLKLWLDCNQLYMPPPFPEVVVRQTPLQIGSAGCASSFRQVLEFLSTMSADTELVDPGCPYHTFSDYSYGDCFVAIARTAARQVDRASSVESIVY